MTAQAAEQRPRVEWRSTPEGLKPFLPGLDDDNETSVAWAPQDGSQAEFLCCPITEVCYEGTRGPGKTDALLMDFAQHCGEDDRSEEDIDAGVPKTKGWGAEWRGVLFRKTYPELQDVIEKSKKWFKQFAPEAFFNEAKTYWQWPTGEKLYFRQFAKPSDYWKYHGHAYPWIAWEELGTWADDKCYKSMFSCSRSTVPGIPRKIRSTTNPFGVGHNWVKARFRLPVPPGHLRGPVIRDSRDENGILEPDRVAIHGQLSENRILIEADPDYIKRLAAAAPSPAAREAWLRGSWDIVAGGMFDDIWFEARRHCIVPAFEVPETWWLDRTFDWGDAKPFGVGWWAESNGEDLLLSDGRVMSTVRGDVFLVREWYGWNGRPNEGCKALAVEIAQGIVERELKMGWIRSDGTRRVRAGAADSSIFDDSNGNCIARDMAGLVRVNGRAYAGVRWTSADKGPGSRKQGWQLIRSRLQATVPPQRGVREQPGLFIVDSCRHWLRTVPVLPRDEKDDLDVDTEAEDHMGDLTRYRLLNRRKTRRVGTAKGAF